MKQLFRPNLARNISSVASRLISSSEIAELISIAGKKEDLISRHPQFKQQIEELALTDPSGSQKYLQWGINQLKSGEPLAEIISLTNQFHSNQQRLPQKDINQYKRLGDLRGVFESIAPSKREQVKLDKSDSDTIYEDDKFLIVHPRSMAASCHYGRGTRWCISATESENYFKDYSLQNINFYFIISKSRAPDDILHKVAIAVSKSGKTEMFSADDTPLSSLSSELQKFEPMVISDAASRPDTKEFVNYPIAKNPSSPPEALINLSKDEDVNIRRAVASNPSSPPELLINLSKDESADVRRAVAQNPPSPPELLINLSKDERADVRRAVASNPSSPPEALINLSKDEDVNIRCEVAINPSSPPELLINLSKDESADVRCAVASNPSAPPDALLQLGRDKEIYVRRRVASNPSAPPDALLQLGRDKEIYVRCRVASNRSIPPEVLLQLSKDRDGEVRQAVASNPNTPPAILTQLSQDKNYEVSMTASRNPNTPRAVKAEVKSTTSKKIAMSNRKLAKSTKEPASKTVKELISLLKQHPQVKQLFIRFNVPIDKLEEIPIRFKKMNVSAKAKSGTIYLNENLKEGGDIIDSAHYIIHEITHVLQQISGKADDYGNLDDVDYLDNPNEIEAFREQIGFIRNYKSQEEADKYLNELLDFHEFKGKEREAKYKQLVGRTPEADPGYVRISVKTNDGKRLQHHYLDAKRWDAPAGRIEGGESPVDAAARELLERTGYRVDKDLLKEVGRSQDGDFYEFVASFEDLERVADPQTEIRLAAVV